MKTNCSKCGTRTPHTKVTAGVYDCDVCGNEKQVAIESAFNPTEKTYTHETFIGDSLVSEFWCPVCKATTQHNINIHTNHCAECGRERGRS